MYLIAGCVVDCVGLREKFAMEALYGVPFMILEVPNLKIKRPSWLKQPSAMVMFSLVLISYFLVTGG